MRIAFFVTEFPSVSETFILGQIVGLIEAGHHVEIFAERPPREAVNHQDIKKFNLAARTRYVQPIPGNTLKRTVGAALLFTGRLGKAPAVMVRTLNVFRFGRQASSLRLLYFASLFVDAGGTFDIVHCHFGPNGEMAVCLREAGALRGRVVATFHGYDIRQGIERGGAIYKHLRQWGDLIFSISGYNRKHLLEFGFAPERIRPHRVGIDVQAFHFRARLRPTGARTRILTIGRLVQVKGIKYALHALSALAQRHPDLPFEYVIIGDGPLRGELEAIAQPIGTVRFLGAQTQEEVRRELDQADIFLLPSIAEALPIVLMEAQAAGLPCVCTKVGSVHEVVLDGQSGLQAPPEDSEALCMALAKLLSNPGCWAEFGAAGRRHVEAEFDVRILVRQLEDYYAELLRADS